MLIKTCTKKTSKQQRPVWERNKHDHSSTHSS